MGVIHQGLYKIFIMHFYTQKATPGLHEAKPEDFQQVFCRERRKERRALGLEPRSPAYRADVLTTAPHARLFSAPQDRLCTRLATVPPI